MISSRGPPRRFLKSALYFFLVLGYHNSSVTSVAYATTIKKTAKETAHMESQCSNVFQGISDADCKHMMECFEARRRAIRRRADHLRIQPGLPPGRDPGKRQRFADPHRRVRRAHHPGDPVPRRNVRRGAWPSAGLTEDSIAVVCDKDAAVLFFEYSRIIRPCSNTCAHHTQLLENIIPSDGAEIHGAERTRRGAQPPHHPRQAAVLFLPAGKRTRTAPPSTCPFPSAPWRTTSAPTAAP